MKITNKAHTVTAIIAAVLAILAILGNLVSSAVTFLSLLRFSTVTVSYIVSIVRNLIGTILMIVVLLRRKKDTVAGVLFIIQLLLTATLFFANVKTVFAGYGTINTVAALIRILGIVACVVFYALLTVECFNPGTISGASVKILPVILPILHIVLLLVATVVQQILGYGDGTDMAVLLLSVLLPNVVSIFGKIWMILLGLAFSIPVYEKPSFESLCNM